jgi:hypothetical protein
MTRLKMDYTDHDMYDREERSDTPGKDAAPQPSNSKARSASAQAGEPPEQEKAPQLLLAAGNTQKEDAAPPQEDTKPSTSSGKASQAADEGKPGIVFEGKAVIDRFEGKWAVLLLGDDEKPVSVPKKSLPRRVQAGQWLNVQLAGQEGDEVVSAKVDPEETARMKKRIMDKLALLRSGAYLTEGTDEKPPQS